MRIALEHRWLDNYGDEEVLCKYVEKLSSADADPSCTIRDSFGSVGSVGSRNGSQPRLYISGESRLFTRRDELNHMVSKTHPKHINIAIILGRLKSSFLFSFF